MDLRPLQEIFKGVWMGKFRSRFNSRRIRFVFDEACVTAGLCRPREQDRKIYVSRRHLRGRSCVDLLCSHARTGILDQDESRCAAPSRLGFSCLGRFASLADASVCLVVFHLKAIARGSRRKQFLKRSARVQARCTWRKSLASAMLLAR